MQIGSQEQEIVTVELAHPLVQAYRAPGITEVDFDPQRVIEQSAALVADRAREKGLDLSAVKGTGPDGRIIRADIDAAIQAKGEMPAAAAAQPLIEARRPRRERGPPTRCATWGSSRSATARSAATPPA